MTHAEILERLKSASGPSRDLDGEIALALGLPQAYFDAFKKDIDGYPFKGFAAVDGPECFGGPTWAGGGRSYDAPESTTSLDAAVALVERAAPGWAFDLDWFPKLNGASAVLVNDEEPDITAKLGRCHAPTAPLALLIALFESLAVKEAEGNV